MIDVPPPLCGNIHFFNHAREASLKSNYKIRMGACLVIGKSVIKSWNKIKTHPKYGYSLHAEISCLLKAKKYDILNSTMYVYREKQGKPAMAKPCPTCMRILRESGVKYVRFTVENYPFYREEIL